MSRYQRLEKEMVTLCVWGEIEKNRLSDAAIDAPPLATATGKINEREEASLKTAGVVAARDNIGHLFSSSIWLKID